MEGEKEGKRLEKERIEKQIDIWIQGAVVEGRKTQQERCRDR
jgi:hypothetical protein